MSGTYSFNQTKVELKYVIGFEYYIRNHTFNQTKVELKSHSSLSRNAS